MQSLWVLLRAIFWARLFDGLEVVLDDRLLAAEFDGHGAHGRSLRWSRILQTILNLGAFMHWSCEKMFDGLETVLDV